MPTAIALSPTQTKRCSLQPDEFRQGKPVNPRGLVQLNKRPVSARGLVWRFLSRSPSRRKVRAWLRPNYSFDLSPEGDLERRPIVAQRLDARKQISPGYSVRRLRVAHTTDALPAADYTRRKTTHQRALPSRLGGGQNRKGPPPQRPLAGENWLVMKCPCRQGLTYRFPQGMWIPRNYGEPDCPIGL